MSTVGKSTGGLKYCLADLDSISVVQRPGPGEPEKLFYNIRGRDAFAEAKLAPLLLSIRTDMLQQPLVCRRQAKPVGVEVVAGERRLACANIIYEKDLPCYDEDQPVPERYRSGQVVLYTDRFGKVVKQSGEKVEVDFEGAVETVQHGALLPTVSGRKLYRQLPIKIISNCDDKKALRINFAENQQHEPVGVQDEIDVVERLLRYEVDGKLLTLEEIAHVLGTNITWVSQTATFRCQLPPEAFAKLLRGEIVRHVAVGLMSYRQEDRESLFRESCKVAGETRSTEIRRHQLDQERQEDSGVIHLDNAKKLEKEGKAERAERERQRAAKSNQRAAKARSKKEQAEKKKDQVDEGDLRKAAINLGLAPKRVKALSADEIEEIYIKGVATYVAGGMIDPEVGREIPAAYAAITRRIARGILEGRRDPVTIWREYQIEIEEWPAVG